MKRYGRQRCICGDFATLIQKQQAFPDNQMANFSNE